MTTNNQICNVDFHSLPFLSYLTSFPLRPIKCVVDNKCWGNQEWTMQRHRQHGKHRVKTRKMSNTDPTKNWG